MHALSQTASSKSTDADQESGTVSVLPRNEVTHVRVFLA